MFKSMITLSILATFCLTTTSASAQSKDACKHDAIKKLTTAFLAKSTGKPINTGAKLKLMNFMDVTGYKKPFKYTNQMDVDHAYLVIHTKKTVDLEVRGFNNAFEVASCTYAFKGDDFKAVDHKSLKLISSSKDAKVDKKKVMTRQLQGTKGARVTLVFLSAKSPATLYRVKVTHPKKKKKRN